MRNSGQIKGPATADRHAAFAYCITGLYENTETAPLRSRLCRRVSRGGEKMSGLAKARLGLGTKRLGTGKRRRLAARRGRAAGREREHVLHRGVRPRERRLGRGSGIAIFLGGRGGAVGGGGRGRDRHTGRRQCRLWTARAGIVAAGALREGSVGEATGRRHVPR